MILSLEQMKANRKLWVDALRSGKYKQGRSWLRYEDRFCCLGVLADVAGCEWKGLGYLAADGECRDLPKRARDFVGLKSVGIITLVEMNDREKRRFSTIAKVIEREPTGFFVGEGSQP